MKKIALFLSIILNYTLEHEYASRGSLLCFKKIPCVVCDKEFDQHYFTEHLETHFKHLMCNMPTVPIQH